MLTRLSQVLVAVLVALAVSITAAPPARAADDWYKAAARSYWQRSANPAGCADVTIYHFIWVNAAGYSDWSTCTIWVNQYAFSTWPAGRACMIIIHEFGHGYGLPDTYDPNDVMYYTTDPYHNIPYVRPPCSV